MILNLLGLQGLNEFIHRSVQTWNLTLVFLGSLALVFIEIWCAFSLVKGRNWARWIYLLTQIIAAQLPVGGIAGLRVSGAVQHSRGIKTRNFPLAGDAKTAGSAGSDAAVRVRRTAVAFSACNNGDTIPAPGFLKVNYALRTLRRRPLPLLSMAGAARSRNSSPIKWPICARCWRRSRSQPGANVGQRAGGGFP